MLAGNFNIKDLKKRPTKTAISITVDTENLKYVKEDMKRNKVNVSLSTLFDRLLENLVIYLKEQNKKEMKNKR